MVELRQNELGIRAILETKYLVSDCGVHMKFITMSAFTTGLIINLVRNAEIMSLEQAHWRLSGYLARVAGIRDRGFIREDASVDVLVYDFDALSLESFSSKQ